MISLLLLFNSQTRVRLQKWYIPQSDKDKKKYIKEIISSILTRRIPACNFVDFKEYKVVYQRYANLFFCVLVENTDNELITLEYIQRFVEILDSYFGSVCELDIIFNFEKVHFIWDELVVGGEFMESNRRDVLEAILDQDDIQRDELENVKTFPNW